MSVLKNLWGWLSNSKNQKTLTLLGSGLAVAVVASWQAYLHFSAPKPAVKPAETITASQGGIAAGGNVNVSASPGGTAIVAPGGKVIIGITLAEHEESLKSRERDIREELAQANRQDKEKIGFLEKELGDAQAKLRRPEASLQDYKEKLAGAYNSLDKFKRDFSSAQLDQAKQALIQGDPGPAEELFRQILAAGKEGAAEAAYQLGLLAQSRLRYADAYDYFSQAVQLQPDTPQYLFALGHLRVEVFRDRFRKTFELFSPKDLTDANNLKQAGIEAESRAQSFIEQGKEELQQAEKELKAGHEAFLKQGDAASASHCLVVLGDAARVQNNWQQAIDYYQQAENLAREANHPGYRAKSLTGMARAEIFGLHLYATAAAHLEQAIELSNTIADKTYLADALELKGKNQKYQDNFLGALNTINRALPIVAQLKDNQRLFYIYLGRGDIYFGQANKILIQASKTNDVKPLYSYLDYAKADYEEAQAIAVQLNWTGMVTATKRFLEMVEAGRKMGQGWEERRRAAEQKAALQLRALYQQYQQMPDPGKAIQQLEEKVADPKASPLFALVLASMYDQEGKYEKAINLYDSLLARNLFTPLARNAQAYLIAEHDPTPEKLARAQQLISQNLEDNPEDPNYLDTMGWVLCKQGNYIEAKPYLEKALKHAPNHLDILFHLGWCEAKLGEVAAARENLQKALDSKGKFAQREDAQKLLDSMPQKGK